MYYCITFVMYYFYNVLLYHLCNILLFHLYTVWVYHLLNVFQHYLCNTLSEFGDQQFERNAAIWNTTLSTWVFAAKTVQLLLIPPSVPKSCFCDRETTGISRAGDPKIDSPWCPNGCHEFLLGCQSFVYFLKGFISDFFCFGLILNLLFSWAYPRMIILCWRFSSSCKGHLQLFWACFAHWAKKRSF